MPGTPETPNAARQVSDEPSPRRLLSSRTVYEGRIWDVVSDSFQLNDDGDPLVRDYIDHPGAVAVLPMNDDGDVLLIKQYRHPVGMDLWEIPAGLLDVEGEDFVARALKRHSDPHSAIGRPAACPSPHHKPPDTDSAQTPETATQKRSQISPSQTQDHDPRDSTVHSAHTSPPVS